MFYPEKIISIKTKDRVLEIGPGANPHPRSDVFLEIQLDSVSEYEAQFGHNKKLITDKPVFFYDGNIFPFNDKEFDYVICSHVLEHVKDIPLFLSEVFRVASKGYFEYPLAIYDFLFDFDVHINFLKFQNDKLLYLKKSETCLKNFKPITQVFCNLHNKGYFTVLLTEMRELFFEGFEWKNDFQFEKKDLINDSFLSVKEIKSLPDIDFKKIGTKKLGKEFFKSLINKIK